MSIKLKNLRLLLITLCLLHVSCDRVKTATGLVDEETHKSQLNYMLETVGGVHYYGKHRQSTIGETTNNATPRGDLFGFNDCTEVETYLKNRVLESLEANFAQQKFWHLENLKNLDRQYSEGAPENSMPADSASTMEKSDASDSGGSSSGPSDFTTTNNQVEGVEEGDFVKNDGKYIYTISQGDVHVSKSWPADQLEEVKVISVGGLAHTLLLTGSDLIVFAYPEFKEQARCQEQAFMNDSNYSYFCSYQQYDTSKNLVNVYDISIPEHATLKNSYALSGLFHNVRRVGNSIRVILQAYVNYYQSGITNYIDTYKNVELKNELSPAKYQMLSEEEFDLAVVSAMDKNEEIIATLSLGDLLSTDGWYSYQGNIQEKKSLLDFGDCRKIHAPSVPAPLGLTQIATINLKSGDLDLTTLLAYSNIIYSSQENLYLTTPVWNWFSWEQESDTTYIHKMNIADEDSSLYLGSGKIEGTIINQFALDEYQGNLRVASTINKIIKLDNEDLLPWQRFNWQQFSQVSILKEDSHRMLTIIGSTDKMGENETIQSVRFIKERGFIVTFRNTDPLFTVDLSNPENPEIIGELKIPGFSSYLHMIDDTHLIGVGMGESGGLKVSLFDVSDMARPAEADNFEIPGAYSDAQWNHKAFTWYASHKLLALPVVSYTSFRYSSELRILSIDSESGINDKGFITMSEMSMSGTNYCTPYWWMGQAQVQRSIFADDFVYAISYVGIKAVDLRNLNSPLAALSFELRDEQENYGCSYGYAAD